LAAIPIRFGKSPESEYFAILQNSFAKERSMLLLYDKDGQIAYQEILPETCLGMDVLSVPDSGRLLVGCASTILEYFPVLQDDGARKMSSLKKH
jgi:hypothetical protein